MTPRDPLPEIVAAASQAIVFRQRFPPTHERSALSGFGGAPVAPGDFRWPRPDRADARPFTFIMQIDCAAVPAAARLGLLPDRGVLFFFHDLTWGESEPFRVVYHEATDARWEPVTPPDDLGPAYGTQAPSVWSWPQSIQDCPILLPRWTFDPVAITFSRAAEDEDAEDPDAPLLWGGTGIAEALRAAQGADVISDQFTITDVIDPDGGARRPFPEFPHDWRAVQICSGLLLERIRHHVPGMSALRHLSESERSALVLRIRDDARMWFDRAASQAPFGAMPQAERDRFWSWLSDKAWLVRFVLSDALTLSIEASMVESAAAAAAVPADAVRRLHSRHALVVRSEGGLFANTPNRMLAAPVDVQGHQWERARTHLLLLELSTNEGLGHHFGEGVFQFWITPDDLEARRFDKVELTADAY